MKLKIGFGLFFILITTGTWLTVANWDATAAPVRNFTYDSGLVPLGPDQVLIALLLPAVIDSDALATVRSRKLTYGQTSCPVGPCEFPITSDTLSGPIELSGGEGLTDSLGNTSSARIIFVSNSPNLRFTGHIVNSVTGTTVSTFSWGSCAGCY